MTERLPGMPPEQRLWPDPERGPWLVTARFARVDGRMEVVGLDLRSTRTVDLVDGQYVDAEPHLRHVLPPSSSAIENETGREPIPLKSEVWRKLPVAALAAELRAAWVAALEDSGLLASNPRAAERWTGPADGGRVTLEDVAAIYLAAQDAGRPPTKTVAETLHLSHSAASTRVGRARAAGLLSPTTRGLSSGGPGASPPVTAAESLRAPDEPDRTP
jgi:hypothetical protein